MTGGSPDSWVVDCGGERMGKQVQGDQFGEDDSPATGRGELLLDHSSKPSILSRADGPLGGELGPMEH